MTTVSTGQVIAWLIIGAFAGSLAAWVVTRRRRGFGVLANIVIGMVGAIIGGFLFELLNINLGLGQITLSVEDLVAAFVGSLILILLIVMIRR